MTVSSIGAATAQQQPTSLQASGLSQQDFMKILLTQLRYQNPLKPMNNQQFIAQMAQFTTLQLTQTQNNQISSLLQMQSANQAIGLIGKTVQVNTSTGTSVGTVSTVTFQNNTPELTVKMANNQVVNNISLSQVTIVQS